MKNNANQTMTDLYSDAEWWEDQFEGLYNTMGHLKTQISIMMNGDTPGPKLRGSRILSVADVKAIRVDHATGEYTHRQLAKMWSCSTFTISSVIHHHGAYA